MVGLPWPPMPVTVEAQPVKIFVPPWKAYVKPSYSFDCSITAPHAFLDIFTLTSRHQRQALDLRTRSHFLDSFKMANHYSSSPLASKPPCKWCDEGVCAVCGVRLDKSSTKRATRHFPCTHWGVCTTQRCLNIYYGEDSEASRAPRRSLKCQTVGCGERIVEWQSRGFGSDQAFSCLERNMRRSQ